jgi:hypothetical protein
MTFDIIPVETGPAIFVIGLLGLLLFAVVRFDNQVAGIMWGLSLVTLMGVVAFGIGVELFLLAAALTVFLLVVGLAVS